MDFYRRTLGWALDNPKTVMFILLVAVVLNVYLLVIIPKGFFPTVDEGRMQGGIRADQSISFQLMQKKFIQFVNIIRADPAVALRSAALPAAAPPIPAIFSSPSNRRRSAATSPPTR